MLVSVIITTYGASKFLIRAINSVQNQSYVNVEIIVVDDNNPSTIEREKTEKMILPLIQRDARIVYIRHEHNQNGAVARNTGINAAKGEFFSFLDDDDFFLPNYIQNNVGVLSENNEYGGICCDVARLFRDVITDVQYYNDKQIISVKDMLIGAAIGTGSNIFLRREVIQRISGFDIRFKRKQDLEFMLRVARDHNIVYSDNILVVKDISNVRKLNYINNRNALELFNDKFKAEIMSLSEEERKQYYVNQYSFLLQIAYDMGKIEYIQESMKELSKYLNDYPLQPSKGSIIKAKILTSIKYGRCQFVYIAFRYIKSVCRVRKSRDLRLYEVNKKVKEILKKSNEYT